MGKIIIIMLVLVILLCFCIYNSWFQREKNKRMFEHEKKKVSPFNSYIAWAVYSVIIAAAIFSVVGYEIYVLMDAIQKIQN
ncbi:hypothetical protein LY28_03356 [Ruminiclostridium sufflavum DSM 19573]|uniref:Uncharacterized protein n=1 Tax=Ruminiclostridium sufflavum DSM 19573 TaxID=1121337 RepID=A0A318Y1X8_9FIRM|nr:hypothetical protein [Ruminiclostridium sufflavum]PYG84998.1 hypothetical protein LY28_03356 [Ruminiclostridium sufflavum DSM 19573]